MGNIPLALGLTVLAGLATAIGSAIAFFAPRRNYRFLCLALSFSAGVMLYVSLTEMLVRSDGLLTQQLGQARGHALAVLAFFSGAALIALVDWLIPAEENPHEPRPPAELAHLQESAPAVRRARLLRLGVLTALAISGHNLAEGLTTFISAMEDPRLGAVIAVAIALHNIPEGISVSVPIYYATNSRVRGMVLSAMSGLTEPLGAILGYLIIHPFLNPTTVGLLYGAVGGVMIFISFDELIPAARAHGNRRDTVCGILAGMIVMAASLLLMYGR